MTGPRRIRRLLVLLASAAALVVAGVVPMAAADEESAERLAASDYLLAMGAAGDLVADLQRSLTDFGIDAGPIDGIFGALTEAAVLEFQSRAEIDVDGYVGPKTKAAILRAVTGDTPDPTPPPVVTGPALSPGAGGDVVVTLQEELTRTGFYRGELDGDFGPLTASAVVAFHKVWGLDRTSTWNSSDWDRIDGWFPAPPGYGSAAFRLEIDLTREVVFVVRNGTVAAVMPVSSGNGELYTSRSGAVVPARTPQGDFTMFRSVDEWERSYLGEMYEPWYFYGGYALHGSTFVPAYPASHGCVRVIVADMDWLDGRLWIGMPVHVWG